MASYPIFPPKHLLGSFHLSSLQFLQHHIVINPLKHTITSNSGSRGNRSFGLRAQQSSSEPNPVGPSSGNGGFPLSNLPPWSRWMFGSSIFSGIPIYKRIRTTQERAEKALAVAAETIEKAAEQTEKMADQLVASLPEGDLKEMACKVEKMAEEVEKEAEAAQELIEKVEKLTDKLDEILEPILEGEIEVKKK